MKFTVTYRANNNSKPLSEVFEAESRSHLFKILTARKISPITIASGDMVAKKRGVLNLSRKNITIVLLVAFVLFLTLLTNLLLKIKINSTDQVRETIATRNESITNQCALVKIALPTVRVVTNESDMVVLPNGIITNKPKTVAEAIRMVRLKPGFHSYKNVDEVFSKTNYFQLGPYKTLNLKSSTESQLSLIATRSRTLTMPPMPPMPPHMEKDFEIAINNYLTETEDDSDVDKATKKKIEMMKNMMLYYVEKEEMTPAQALREIENNHNRAANMYQLYRGEYIKMVHENSPDADAFYDAAINALKEKGAPIFDRNARCIEE